MPPEAGIRELTELIGLTVADERHVLGKLVDVGVRESESYPPVTRLLARRGRRRVRHFRWSAAEESSGQLRFESELEELAPDGHDELLLRRDVLDCQIFDLAGKRLTRVGDVELAVDGAWLRVVAVDVGASAILRRLGLRALARRTRRQALDWESLHLASVRGHALQLDKPTAAVHRLGPADVARLVSRLPPARATELLGRLDPETEAKTREVLAERHPPRRRFRSVLSARRRAPA